MKRALSFLVLAIGGILFVVFGAELGARQPNAEAAVDITGQWTLELTGLGLNPVVCTGQFTQDQTALSADLVCADVLTVTLNGEIDPASGHFTLSGDFGGVATRLGGVAAGDKMNGTFRKPPDSGAFSGTRILPTPTPTPSPTPGPLDLTGDWALQPWCILHIVQTSSRLSGATTCGTGRIVGTVDADAGTFTLGWLDRFSYAIALTGTADSHHMNGTVELAMTDETFDFYGYRVSIAWGSTACPSSLPPLLEPRHYPPLYALRILQAGAGAPSSDPDSCILPTTDVNFDGRVDALDAMLLLQYEAGLIPRLPVL